MSTFRELPCLPSANVPTHQPFWVLPMLPLVTTTISLGNPLVQCAYPEISMVAGVVSLLCVCLGNSTLVNLGQMEARRATFRRLPSLRYLSTGGPHGPSKVVWNILLHSSHQLLTRGPLCLPQPVGEWAAGSSPSSTTTICPTAPIIFPMNSQQWPQVVFWDCALPTFQITAVGDRASTKTSGTGSALRS